MNALSRLILPCTLACLCGCATSYKDLDTALTNAATVTELNLSNKKLTELSYRIGDLTNLKTLNLFGNRIERLPREIGKLKNLERLILSSNNIHSLPPEIGQLTNL